MSNPQTSPLGSIAWHDLTVPNADAVRAFYEGVVGWKSAGQSMGEYEDFNMIAGSGETVAGVCHARGENADLPPQWLMYILVADVAESASRCESLGGHVVVPLRPSGAGKVCVIRDPAGAVCALYQE